MPVRKKFNIQECSQCVVYFNIEGQNPPGLCGHCRLNPPTPINAYSSGYPVVRKSNPACFSGVAGSKPAPKGKK